MKHLLASFVLLLESSCVTIPNLNVCSPAGVIQAGADCAETNTGRTSEMTQAEFMALIEGGGVCMSALDYSRLKTAVEQACKELGKRCSYEGVP